MSSIFHDRPMSAIDKAIYWVEYVIRHKGAHHLRSSAVDLTWYQYYLLDVTVFLILIIFSLIYIFYFITKCSMKLVFKFMFKQTKIKRSQYHIIFDFHTLHIFFFLSMFTTMVYFTVKIKLTNHKSLSGYIRRVVKKSRNFL